MKKYLLKFLHRGLAVCAGGPLVLAVVYGILGALGVVEALTPFEVSLGIIGITIMAFIAAGVTVVYEIERLPLASALLIHGIALYIDYAIVYLVNGWLADGIIPFLIFTAIFVVGYAIVWTIVYLYNKKKTDGMNKKLSSK